MPGALQNGREPLSGHCHRLRHEGVWLGAEQGLRLCEGASGRDQAQPLLHETAGGISGHPDGQVCRKKTHTHTYNIKSQIVIALQLRMMSVAYFKQDSSAWCKDLYCEVHVAKAGIEIPRLC